MRALKSEIAACLDEDAKIALTPERRERMLGLLGTYESWSTLPESVRDSAIENADPQQLAEYVLSNEHFRSFYDKVLESDQVRQRVEKEKAQYAAEAAEAQAAAKQAKGVSPEREILPKASRRSLSVIQSKRLSEAATWASSSSALTY